MFDDVLIVATGIFIAVSVVLLTYPIWTVPGWYGYGLVCLAIVKDGVFGKPAFSIIRFGIYCLCIWLILQRNTWSSASPVLAIMVVDFASLQLEVREFLLMVNPWLVPWWETIVIWQDLTDDTPDQDIPKRIAAVIMSYIFATIVTYVVGLSAIDDIREEEGIDALVGFLWKASLTAVVLLYFFG